MILLFNTLLAACGSDESETPPPAPAPSATSSPQVLLIWHTFQGDESDALAQIRADFEVKYPNIDVQLEFMEESTLRDTFATAVLDGSGPDLLFGPLAWIPDLAARGVIQPIRLTFYDTVFSMIAESVARSTFYQGSPYGVPFSADFPAFYYNRKLMLTPPDTFNDLMAEAANHGLIIQPTFAATSAIYLSLDDQFADRVTIDPALVETFLGELQTLANTPGVTFTPDQTAFLQGQAGWMMAPSGDYAALLAALGDDLGVMRYPSDREWRGLSTIWPVMQSINSPTEALDAGESFISFLLSPAAQRAWFEQTHHAPVSVAALDNDLLRVAWSLMLSQSVTAPADFVTRVSPLLDQAVQAVTLNGGDPAAAAEAVAAALQ
jgi:arabinogalactan oligomer/maltooligosaccharide transport system substrate-binding protein